MHYQRLAFAALAATLASAQELQNLTAALGANENLTALVTLVGAYPDLLASLGNATNITLLAPSNEALNALLNSTAGTAAAATPGFVEALLSYHVLNSSLPAANITDSFVHTSLTNTSYANVTGGQSVQFVGGDNVTIFSGLKNNVSVVQADIQFNGGYIHVIDGVLTIPQNITTTALDANLTSLAGAISSLNLTETLNNLGDVTIFAPSNSAIQGIGSVLGNLSTADLVSILSYHVVEGAVLYSPNITNGTFPTLGGGNVTVTVLNGTVYVNSARVTNPDFLVSNGVIHVIDAVLNPNVTDATANPAEPSATVTVFTGASSVTEVPFTSLVTASTTVAGAGASASTSVSAGGAATSSSSGIAAPMKTGAVGAAALFGGAAFIANW